MNPDDVWLPSTEYMEQSNLAQLIRELGQQDYTSFLKFSNDNLEKYWEVTLKHLNITFDPLPEKFLDISSGAPWAKFFPGAGFNYATAAITLPDADPDRLALSWEDENNRSGSMSYRELAQRTRRFASGLAKLGVKPGDRVGFLFPNIPEAVITFLAIGYMGAVAVPLYTGYGTAAIGSRLADANASILVTADGFYRRGRYISLAKLAKAVLDELPTLKDVVIVADQQSDFDFPYHNWCAVEESGCNDMPAHATKANDPFMVIYTSGTSGKPKGTVHVHAGFPLRVAQDVAYLFDFKPGDRYFWMSDMGWMVGPFSICSVLINKGTYVLYDGSPDVPDIGRLRAVAARHKVTHFGSSPTSVRAMAADEDVALTPNADCLRVLMTGGEVMDADSHHWYFQKFGDGRLPIINYTGGTEVSGALLSNVVLRKIVPSHFNSTAPGVKCVIIDSEGKSVSGAPGELAIAQPFVGMTQGFWKDNDRYLETYWSKIDGIWLHGDLAMIEADGQYMVLGRSDDVMKISGKRVGPSEVEGVIVDSASVNEAAVFSVQDKISGEVMVVLVVPDSSVTDYDALTVQVIKVLKTKMGPAFSAKAVVAVKKLAKTRNGKIVRRLAKQAWLGEKPGDLSALEDSEVFYEMSELCEQYKQVHFM